LFLSAFEKLRKSIIENKSICSLLHIGRGIFGIDWGSVAFTLRNILVNNYYGQYFRLHTRLFQYIDPNDIKDLFLKAKNDHSFKFNFDNYGNNSELFNDGKLRMIGDCNGQKIHYIYNQENFKLIPGYPIAYWANSNLIEAFEKGKPMNSVVEPKVGLETADNNRFLRLWHEVNYYRINFQCKSIEDSLNSKAKWFPYNKGGPRRQWYGNYDYVVNWENDGFEIRNFKDRWGKQRSVVRNPQYYFREAITWSLITSGGFSIRYREAGSIHDVAGMSAFSNNHDKLMYILGLMSTKIANYVFKILNPTISLQVGDFNNFPVLFIDSKPIINIVEKSIDIAKQEWDSFETSWDFKKHPLLAHKKEADTVEGAFNNWSAFANQQFNQLKANEEELNRIFIEIYGLQDELTPDVDDKDVTITRIYDSKEDIPESMKGNNYVLTREDVIKSFISYAVGCMFGRYSLDEEGLIYAGGDFDDKFRIRNGQWEIKTKEGWKKSRVNIVEHNVIPIVDGDYFEDGILERFVDFVKVSFGEETLEENLDYIAETLGRKANETSRQAIRRYFLKDFYKDHVRTYKKRPIYWLFDSGRQDGFKALIYMHRYDPSTVARVRTDYLHSLQKKYEAEINHLDILIDSDISQREKAAARKKKEKILKQIEECRLYDEAIAHVANQRIEIDLDDGVKVNYAKFQGVEIPQGKGRKPLKADLLAKI
jgi:tRNA-dihydrouridine synthase